MEFRDFVNGSDKFDPEYVLMIFYSLKTGRLGHAATQVKLFSFVKFTILKIWTVHFIRAI